MAAIPIPSDGATGEAGADGDQLAGIREITGTTDTLLLADAGKYLRFTNDSAIAATVPANATVAFPEKTVITLYQEGEGTITATAAGGVTLNGDLESAGQGKALSLIKIGTDEWDVIGGVTS